MSLNTVNYSPAFISKSNPSSRMSLPVTRRLLLLLGCVASVGLAAWVGEPAAYLRADPELAFLLRGMAAIKAAIVVAAAGVLFWRFGYPVSQGFAAAYLVGTWLIAGATMLVWRLSFIELAAPIFHAGAFALLIVAWRDHQGRLLGRSA